MYDFHIWAVNTLQVFLLPTAWCRWTCWRWQGHRMHEGWIFKSHLGGVLPGSCIMKLYMNEKYICCIWGSTLCFDSSVIAFNLPNLIQPSSTPILLCIISTTLLWNRCHSNFIAKETEAHRSYGTILSNIMNVISGRATFRSRLICSKVIGLSTLHTVNTVTQKVSFLPSLIYSLVSSLSDHWNFSLSMKTSYFFFICISNLGDLGRPLDHIHLLCLISSTYESMTEKQVFLTHLLQETQIPSSFASGYSIRDDKWESHR